MKLSLLTIGNELLDGRVRNTNAQFVGAYLNEWGYSLESVMMVSDHREDLLAALRVLKPLFDVLIITGGLGPTEDDRTLSVLAEYLEMDLEFRANVYDDLRSYFKKRGRDMPENNKKQAFLPRGADYFKNEWGSAPACAMRHQHTLFFCLPGVPFEMRHLMTHYLPDLLKTFSKQRGFAVNKKEKRLFRCEGLSEAALAEQVDACHGRPLALELSYQASFPEVILQFSYPSMTPALRSFFNRLYTSLKPYIFSQAEGSLFALLKKALLEKQQRMALAESCTGGLLAAELCALPGISTVFSGSIVAYDNEIKSNLLYVPERLITKEGAVSAAVAIAMLKGVFKRFDVDWALAITGIAGPDSDKTDKPVGSVFIAYGCLHQPRCKFFTFRGQREDVQRQAVKMAVLLLLKEVLTDPLNCSKTKVI